MSETTGSANTMTTTSPAPTEQVDDGYVIALPHHDRRHATAHHFLNEEAAILDSQRWERWLDLLHPEIRYVMPVRVTVAAGEVDELDMAHFDEDHYSLHKRVERLRSGHAWTEDPPSRTRHLVTNVRTHATAVDTELDVESTVLLFRSRGDTRPPELVCAQRHDRLVQVGERWVLRERRLVVDESVLRTQNLAIFL